MVLKSQWLQFIAIPILALQFFIYNKTYGFKWILLFLCFLLYTRTWGIPFSDYFNRLEPHNRMEISVAMSISVVFYSSVLLWIFLLSCRQKAYQKALFWILSFCILYMILLTSIQQFSLLQFTQFEGVLEFLKKLSVITFWCLLVISGISILLFWIVFYCRRTSFTSFICSRLYLEEEAKKNYC